MRVLLYLFLMLGSLLGGTAQVLAGEVRLAEEVLDQLHGDDRCLNDHLGLLPDFPPLPSDTDPRLVAAEKVFTLPRHASLTGAFETDPHASAEVSNYSIRAPPLSVV
ncbi:hypothetical protein GCM10011352_20390 [Marinobacterium zhoushanense]|uniref:Uncharacterized protein n=1 Tax=Marinobacterium zhoushanense TaxID=1679163 RepID=A0ABQ1KAY7_9GAMM|nr:hypothetical protein [Marinobacterium zhoushanense]GGB94259.1 hypothetical protein GCM10011352_20390 [Marinobacterium zhoushanense]